MQQSALKLIIPDYQHYETSTDATMTSEYNALIQAGPEASYFKGQPIKRQNQEDNTIE